MARLLKIASSAASSRRLAERHGVRVRLMEKAARISGCVVAMKSREMRVSGHHRASSTYRNINNGGWQAGGAKLASSGALGDKLEVW
jgi:hypothetical protein